MRIYTCVFEKSGAVEMKDVTAPWDRAPAEQAVKEELKISEPDRLIALIPGQHSRRAWIVEGSDSEGEKPATKKAKFHSGVSIKDYIPNGF